MVSATVRDIAIILVALEILVMNGLLVLLVWQVWRLVRMVRAEIRPVIRDGQETVGTVKGSAEFVSANFVSPIITASSRLAGFRRAAKVMRSELESSMGEVVPKRRQNAGPGGDAGDASRSGPPRPP